MHIVQNPCIQWNAWMYSFKLLFIIQYKSIMNSFVLASVLWICCNFKINYIVTLKYMDVKQSLLQTSAQRRFVVIIHVALKPNYCEIRIEWIERYVLKLPHNIRTVCFYASVCVWFWQLYMFPQLMNDKS